MKKIAVIIPSRSGDGYRPKGLLDAFISWADTTDGESDFYIGLDTDDADKYSDVLPNMIRNTAQLLLGPNQRFVPKLNRLGLFLAEAGYQYVFFMGDDHRFRTKGWENSFIDAGGISYGNDLLQGSRLPTAVCIDSNIIKKLGFMAPPCLQHMYADDFWRDFGSDLGILHYHDSITIEHMHFSKGKSPADSQYFANAALHKADKIAYDQYKATQYLEDLKRFK